MRFILDMKINKKCMKQFFLNISFLFRYSWKISKRIFAASLLSTVFNTVEPFVPLLFSGIILDELKHGLTDKAISLLRFDSLSVYIARKTYGSKKNARGIRDCVRREVEDLLAELIVFHQDTEIKKFTITAAEKITAEIN